MLTDAHPRDLPSSIRGACWTRIRRASDAPLRVPVPCPLRAGSGSSPIPCVRIACVVRHSLPRESRAMGAHDSTDQERSVLLYKRLNSIRFYNYDVARGNDPTQQAHPKTPHAIIKSHSRNPSRFTKRTHESGCQAASCGPSLPHAATRAPPRGDSLGPRLCSHSIARSTIRSEWAPSRCLKSIQHCPRPPVPCQHEPAAASTGSAYVRHYALTSLPATKRHR